MLLSLSLSLSLSSHLWTSLSSSLSHSGLSLSQLRSASDPRRHLPQTHAADQSACSWMCLLADPARRRDWSVCSWWVFFFFPAMDCWWWWWWWWWMWLWLWLRKKIGDLGFFFPTAMDCWWWWWWWLWLWLMVEVIVDVFLDSGIYYFIVVVIIFYCDVYIILLCWKLK